MFSGYKCSVNSIICHPLLQNTPPKYKYFKVKIGQAIFWVVNFFRMNNLQRIFRKALSRNPNVYNKLYSSSEVIDPPESLFVIPKAKTRENEPTEKRKARLLYQSRKRGMLENDLLLSTFAAKYLDKFTEQQVEQYDSLINGPSNDWDIYYWATNTKPTPEEYNHGVMELLKLHTQNLNKESRIRQPDLY